MRTVDKRRKLKQAKCADKPEQKWQEVWLGCSCVISRALSMLEPYEVKVSRAVLGGPGGGNIPRLPDI